MDVLARRDLGRLIGKPGGTCVSVYMPTHRRGRETEQGPIRLRNLLDEAVEELRANGLSPREVRGLLAPAEPFFVDALFWQHQSDGLALFFSSAGLSHYRVPLAFDELVVVADHFHVKPLLPLLSADGRFLVLAISQNAVRLLQCTHFGMDVVDPEGMPASLAEALRFDDAESHLQFHTGTSTAAIGSGRPAMFHGQGGGKDEAKTDILRYFQQIDKGLREFVADEQTPVVLAGVDYLLPIYREASSYAHLVQEGIEGNPDELSAEVLHQRAWEIVRPLFAQAEQEAIARYRQLGGAEGEQASDDLGRIAPAAYSGRVDIVFVALGVQRWGTFDPRSHAAELHDEPKPGDEDLLDFAAVQALLNGGRVYALDRDDMPGGSSIAAIFRY